ncbi:hypothetical protein TWF694_011013 [Orbilia ellipsospora]|uniref:Secreted protein n=1 Tax=Orbilia ellipsospora TaxID=2528407 RepID=A0AAV9X946_9PEZI
MKLAVINTAITGLALIGSAMAAKGKATVKACIFLQTGDSSKPFDVKWTAGTNQDTCMKQRGSSGTMRVSKHGMNCYSIGDVEVDDSWGNGCVRKESRWGLSYTIDDKLYSGSTRSKWTTGPWNSDIRLNDESPGTNVCGSDTTCSDKFLKWSNSNHQTIYIVFRPEHGKTLDNAPEITRIVEHTVGYSFRTQNSNPRL